MIEEYSDLKLPKDYKVLQATSESAGFAGADFLVTVELEFDSLNFVDLLRTVPTKSNEWGEDGGNIYYSKDVSPAETVSIVIEPASKLLRFTFNHL